MIEHELTISVMVECVIRTVIIPRVLPVDAGVLMASAQELSYTIFGKGETDDWVCNRADELDKEMFN